MCFHRDPIPFMKKTGELIGHPYYTGRMRRVTEEC